MEGANLIHATQQDVGKGDSGTIHDDHDRRLWGASEWSHIINQYGKETEYSDNESYY